MMLRALPPTDPIMLLATAELSGEELRNHPVEEFFGSSIKNRCGIADPTRVSQSKQKIQTKLNKVKLLTTEFFRRIASRTMQRHWNW